MPQLIETTLWEDAQAPTNGVIPNVVVLGQKSRNGRFYTEDAMRGAVSLYEGKAVYISHAGEKVKHRPATERYGRLRNVRFDEATKKLRGDLVYLESQQQMSSMLKEDIERKLNFFGLSHVADGQFHLNNGVKVVTKIDKVTSVDVVSDPATVTSLMEATEMPAAGDPAAAGPDPQVEAMRAGINAILDKGGDYEALKTAILAFVNGEADKPKDGATSEPAKEQTDATSLAKLVEQTVAEVLAKQKPKKYITPAAPPKTVLTEQTDATGTKTLTAPPKDKAALKKWLNK